MGNREVPQGRPKALAPLKGVPMRTNCAKVGVGIQVPRRANALARNRMHARMQGAALR